MVRVFLFIFSLFAFVSCTKEEILVDVVFNVSVTKVGCYSAEVTVTHDGSNRDAYYGFAVKGEVTNLKREISDYIFFAEDGELESSVHYQRKSVYTVRGLIPNTTYTYIVFGMDAKGVCGIPSSVVFTTSESNIVAETNPNWSVSYDGHAVRNDIDYSVVSVNVEGETNEYYFIATYLEKEVNAYAKIEDFLGIATSELHSYIEKEYDLDNWFECDRVRTKSTSNYQHLKSGNYVSFAIGLNERCEPTGHYARTDVYHVDKYPVVPAYANLLGEWFLVDNTNTFLVTFTENRVNHSFIMYGWGNYKNPEIPIYVSFDRNSGSISFPCQIIFDDYIHKFKDGSVYKGELSFRGVFVNSKGKRDHIDNDPVEGKLQSDGTYNFKGFRVRNTDGTIYDETGMNLFLDTNDTDVFIAWMMFPWIMVKNE